MGDLLDVLSAGRVGRGEFAGLAVSPDGGVVVGTAEGEFAASFAEVGVAEATVRPRWVMWSQETAQQLAAAGVRLATCWDVAAVHRLLFGGWRADPVMAWACLHGVPADQVPAVPTARAGGPDLFSAAEDARADAGVSGPGFSGAGVGGAGVGGAGGVAGPEFSAWRAVLAARLQASLLDEQGGGIRVSTARSESTAELLCAELAADGLPVDLAAAERLLGGLIGPRPRGTADAAAIRAERDERVLRHAPAGVSADLRSPVQVKSLLAAAGVDVPDTRAWRLEAYKDSSPLVAALLEWRKAERIATTYGYAWLDEHLGPDGRLRGAWTGSDGAAGRMTASAGLHNMPSVLRQAVIAADGHLFVRADLGQIEPRVLAAVSGDAALAAAASTDDMYRPVASQLGVDRPTAKVAMIAAMYGQTTGHGGTAARRMRTAYPIAMGYLDAGDRSARGGSDLRTYGGRLVRMSTGGDAGQMAARGRYGRNALIQGAAAELFKMWAVTVRARAAALDAEIVLCLHDELLVHVPAARAAQAAEVVRLSLTEATRRWAPATQVRFIADISVVRCWADAKG